MLLPSGVDDLLGEMSISGSAPPAALNDPFAALSATSVSAPAPTALPVLLSAEKGKGLTVTGRLVRQNGNVFYGLNLSNGSGHPLDGFMIQLNSNSFGLVPTNQALAVGTLQPGASATTLVPLAHSNPAKTTAGAMTSRLQVALKCNPLGVSYFEDAVYLPALLNEEGTMDGQTFLAKWRNLPPEAIMQMPSLTIADVSAAEQKLKASHLFLLAHRPVPGTAQEALYIAARADSPSVPVLVELRITRGVPGTEASCKCEREDLVPLIFDAVQQILSQ